jgi:hypothetical protein
MSRSIFFLNFLDPVLTEFWIIENKERNKTISESIIRTKWWRKERNLEFFIKAMKIMDKNR